MLGFFMEASTHKVGIPTAISAMATSQQHVLCQARESHAQVSHHKNLDTYSVIESLPDRAAC